MALYRSKGIVLRSIRYGESDRILDLYTLDRGLVSVIAKGIRRVRSRIGARLEPLSCVDFMAYQGRTLDTITQVEILRSFHAVRERLDRFEAAGAMVRTVRALSGGGEADRRVFNLLYHGLDSLERSASCYKSIEASFSLKLSTLAGYAPQLDACLNCSGEPELAGNPYFAPSLGGVLCTDCRTVAREAFPIPVETLERLKALIEKPIRDAAFGDTAGESVRRVVRAHVLAHAPGDSVAISRSTAARRPA